MSREHRLRMQIGTDEHGAPIIRQIRGSSELDLSEKIIKAAVESGRYRDYLPQNHSASPISAEASQKHIFSDYAERWRMVYKAGLEQYSMECIRAKLSVLNRTFGSMYVEDLTPELIQSWMTARAEAVTHKTIRGDWGTLKDLLQSAVDDGLLQRNPAKDRRLKNPGRPGSGTKALTRDQIAEIRQKAILLDDPRQRLILSLLAYTSMRREELLGLTWENVDFDKREIHIVQAVTYPRSQPVIKSTKTSGSRRILPIDPALYKVLVPLKATGFIISAKDGTQPISEVTFRRDWADIGTKINLYGGDSNCF